MDVAQLLVNVALFVVTASATAIAWWQAIAAGRAKVAAETAQDAALDAWKEASAALVRANLVADNTLRGPYAWGLYELGTAVLAARMVGEPPESVRQIALDRSAALAEKSFQVGDASTSEISVWTAGFSRFSELGTPPDVDQYIEATNLLGDRIRLWQLDPAAALAAIGADPRYTSPFG